MDFNEYQGLTAEGSSVAKPLANTMAPYRGPANVLCLRRGIHFTQGFNPWHTMNVSPKN